MVQIISGVYCITNIVDRKRYIGSSNNIRKRWSQHRSRLGQNKNESRYLQNAINKYGLEKFIFNIIDTCEPSEELLLALEQKYIDLLNPEYNIARVAGTTRGVKLSAESKRKMSIAGKGRKKSNIHKLKIGNSNKKSVYQICPTTLRIINTFCSIKEAGAILNIDFSDIAKVARGKRRIAGNFFWKFKN